MRKIGRYAVQDLVWGYVMVAPVVLGLALFYVWPVIQTVYYTFTDWGSFGNYTWTGLDNYRALFRDVQFYKALRNTVLYVLLTVPPGIAVAILFAVLLNRKIRGQTLYRVIYFLPVITMPAAVAMVWRWLYNADYGLINYLLSLIGIKGPGWLTDPDIALYSVVLVIIWSSLGNNIILFLSGLQGIGAQYYEAAEIDGAGTATQFFRITLPLLTPTIFFVSVMSLISAFQLFDVIYMMVGEIGIEATQTVVYLFYKYAFLMSEKGYAATVATVLFAIILTVTVVQMRMQRKWVHYE
ncbi:carbohydrate ABC transporter permease [Paenibacillus flagellatus]|uniref:Sugar ABC transporter permease n=1 Tax=Paenibacillus flagellatus TaxID=2211139 RepID=A0A2V5KE66_9BACL|nr:sugar ABC transporter permease [Paenibacillus flagellatus]PYI57342.1 sugar ABC transporter permease [Paenibacillus flagellatus]